MSAQPPRMMIFIPLTHAAARAIRTAGNTDDELPGFAATGQLIKAHDYRPDEREDADYAAQVYASVAGLAEGDDDRRLVLAADVPISRVADGRADVDYGSIQVRGLAWQDVTAVFVDEPAAAVAVAAARKAIMAGEDQQLAAILELPAVKALDDHELLWHTPDENW
ncbi:hypothetical protein FOE78_11295 [Microlunatus elymi]|uniref:Uncharacterized protein n=1 Tax=Microlunatus elymi TaxID=2596828 RepID=A0A516PZ15_9ACTN|nr:hypothetical protein [Microlunatus elymi]QDP96410.1 hypothetical protein FOE78_11295 [Microlunatus elymi]